MLELIDREKATVLNAVPTMIIAMLHEPRFQAGEFDTSSLRCVLTAGTPIPVPLMEQVKARWGAEPEIMFGMTEASPIVTQTLPDDSFELRSATVGIPLPHTEVKIVDPNGTVVDVGQPGEILVRGYNVMRGYYRMPEQGGGRAHGARSCGRHRHASAWTPRARVPGDRFRSLALCRQSSPA